MEIDDELRRAGESRLRLIGDRQRWRTLASGSREDTDDIRRCARLADRDHEGAPELGLDAVDRGDRWRRERYG